MSAAMQDRSKLNFNMGSMLFRAASVYATLSEVLQEQVQNALDSGATRIGIAINKKTRVLSVTDNGDGVDKENFDEALVSVGATVKSTDKMGRFGLGLISPLGKCERFTFTSRPEGPDGIYRRWIFDAKDIRRQTAEVHIPCTELPGISYNPDAPAGTSGEEREVPWRTCISVQGYVADPVISRIDSIDSIVHVILSKFRNPMLKRDVRIFVRFTDEKGQLDTRDNITASQFTGKPLEEVTIDNTNAGMTTFKLFLANNSGGGRKGKVLIGEQNDDYRFEFRGLVHAAPDSWLPIEVVQALASGVFEGEILSTYASLDANRKSFERNAAMQGFCETLVQWFEDHGKAHVQTARNDSEDKRYSQLGEQSLKTLEQLLSQPALAGLRSVMDSFARGSSDQGDEKPASKDVGEGTVKEIDVPVHEFAEPSGSAERPPSLEPPGGFSVAAPRMKRRTLVKHAGISLRIAHMVMEGSDRLYDLDTREGVLNFNIRHPQWVACEDSDRRVRQLQEFCAVQALYKLTLPPDWVNVADHVFDDQIPSFVSLLQLSPSFGHVPRPKDD